MRILIVALILTCPAVALGQRAPFPIPDPDPEVERKSFQVADGFEVNLFAADPILAKPILGNQPRQLRDHRATEGFQSLLDATAS
jgi:hypothetical protein